MLELDSSMKSTPQGYMEFYQEKQNRLETREEGAIQISIEHALNDDESGGRLTLAIIDSGKGFDYGSSEIVNKNDYSGRGLKLVSSLSA